MDATRKVGQHGAQHERQVARVRDDAIALRGAHDDDGSPRARGASLAWVKHADHAGCAARRTWDGCAGARSVVFVVRDSGRTFGVRPLDVHPEHDARATRTTIAAVVRDAAARSGRVRMWDAWTHGPRGERRYALPHAGTSDPTAVVIHRRMRDAIPEGYAPHVCPRTKNDGRGISRTVRVVVSDQRDDVPDPRVRAMMARQSRMTTAAEREQHARERATLSRERAARIAARERAAS